MTKYKYVVTNQFRKDVKLCIKQGKDINLLEIVISILLEKGMLPPTYHPHKLSGCFAGYWECHIQSDWLLIWQQNDDELIMLMTRTGTHSALFD